MEIALTIAGSDSGGGAGIQADLKTFHRFGVYGVSAVTAITAQNTLGVAKWVAVTPDMVRAQIDAIATDLRPRATKTGMLANRRIVAVVACSISEHRLSPYVLDPVMVATSGDILLDDAALAGIRRDLVPLADIVTPNLDEASILLGSPVRDVGAMELAARHLFSLGARGALVKGGHLAGDRVIDVFFDGTQVDLFERPKLDTRHTHGTGCTLSAAIAANLALGHDLRTAVTSSLDFVHAAIATAPGLGSGHGPLNHFATIAGGNG
ncbi:MAG: bifunctional hydroxymethylpyrimidine kinase/phosphomethylpyrimidine kinase [Gemmatimonadaceae bacterium]